MSSDRPSRWRSARSSVAIDDDIARIAALRGKPVEHYQAAAAAQRAAAQAISFNDVLGLMTQPENGVARDLRAYESLPAASRAFLREFPFSVSAVKFCDMIERVGDEALVLAAMQRWLPALTQAWVTRWFGVNHPTVRRLG